LTQVNTDYPFVTGPASSAVNDRVAFADATGKTLKVASTPFIQASDSSNQAPGVTTPVQVSFNTTDGSSGIVNSSGNFTISEAGLYMIIAGAQIGEVSNNGNVNVDVWLRKNATDIPNSGVRNFVTSTLDTKVVMTNVIARFAAGDVLKVMMSVDDSSHGAGLRALAPAGEAAIPSIILSVYKVAN